MRKRAPRPETVARARADSDRGDSDQEVNYDELDDNQIRALDRARRAASAPLSSGATYRDTRNRKAAHDRIVRTRDFSETNRQAMLTRLHITRTRLRKLDDLTPSQEAKLRQLAVINEDGKPTRGAPSVDLGATPTPPVAGAAAGGGASAGPTVAKTAHPAVIAAVAALGLEAPAIVPMSQFYGTVLQQVPKKNRRGFAAALSQRLGDTDRKKAIREVNTHTRFQLSYRGSGLASEAKHSLNEREKRIRDRYFENTIDYDRKATKRLHRDEVRAERDAQAEAAALNREAVLRRERQNADARRQADMLFQSNERGVGLAPDVPDDFEFLNYFEALCPTRAYTPVPMSMAAWRAAVALSALLETALLCWCHVRGWYLAALLWAVGELAIRWLRHHWDPWNRPLTSRRVFLQLSGLINPLAPLLDISRVFTHAYYGERFNERTVVLTPMIECDPSILIGSAASQELTRWVLIHLIPRMQAYHWFHFGQGEPIIFSKLTVSLLYTYVVMVFEVFEDYRAYEQVMRTWKWAAAHAMIAVVPLPATAHMLWNWANAHDPGSVCSHAGGGASAGPDPAAQPERQYQHPHRMRNLIALEKMGRDFEDLPIEVDDWAELREVAAGFKGRLNPAHPDDPDQRPFYLEVTDFEVQKQDQRRLSVKSSNEKTNIRILAKVRFLRDDDPLWGFFWWLYQTIVLLFWAPEGWGSEPCTIDWSLFCEYHNRTMSADEASLRTRIARTTLNTHTASSVFEDTVSLLVIMAKRSLNGLCPVRASSCRSSPSCATTGLPPSTRPCSIAYRNRLFVIVAVLVWCGMQLLPPFPSVTEAVVAMLTSSTPSTPALVSSSPLMYEMGLVSSRCVQVDPCHWSVRVPGNSIACWRAADRLDGANRMCPKLLSPAPPAPIGLPQAGEEVVMCYHNETRLLPASFLRWTTYEEMWCRGIYGRSCPAWMWESSTPTETYLSSVQSRVAQWLNSLLRSSPSESKKVSLT